MRRIKRLTAILALAMAASLCTPQALAGDMHFPIAGPTETPSATGTIHTGFTGDMGTPGATGDIGMPGLDGWIGTGLYGAIASLFS